MTNKEYLTKLALIQTSSAPYEQKVIAIHTLQGKLHTQRDHTQRILYLIEESSPDYNDALGCLIDKS
jgi:hypothetical protein